MSDKTTIEINVDTFSEDNGYFIRTEINAYSVKIEGPYPDLQTAQKQKAAKIADRERVSKALRDQLQGATLAFPATS